MKNLWKKKTSKSRRYVVRNNMLLFERHDQTTLMKHSLDRAPKQGHLPSHLIQIESDKETGAAWLTSISLDRHKRLKWLFGTLLKIYAIEIEISYAKGSQYVINTHFSMTN